MGDFAFDEDSRVVADGLEGAYAAELTSRWNGTAGAVNGGYMLATCTRALAQGMPFPDPIVTNVCFGGADLRTAYVTCSATGKLVSLPWPRPGLALAF